MCYSWWIAGLILHRHDLGWLIPFLVWLGLSIRIFTLVFPLNLAQNVLPLLPTRKISSAIDSIQPRYRLAFLALLTLAVVLAGTFGTQETPSNTRADRAVSLFGLAVFLTMFWVTSRNRKEISWRAVLMGILSQFLLGLFVLRTKAGVWPPRKPQ